MSTHITIREPRGGLDLAAGDLLLVAGPGQLLTFPLDRPEIIIGRDPQCDIVINHKTLSRRHAKLLMGPPVTVEDLGSTNGIVIDGQRARHAVLSTGSRIEIGSTRMSITSPGSDV